MTIKASIQKTQITYQGKSVQARKLVVTSQIPLLVDTAWALVKKPALLEFITQGKIKFKPVNKHFPKEWQQGSTVVTHMYLYGVLPFGGAHMLYFEQIDDIHKCLQTRERDRSAKVWDHLITMQKTNENTTQYTDEIIIYGGWQTSLIVYWTKAFYKHRQKRWHLLAQKPEIQAVIINN
ncbi:MAG TPA: hypothetical protein DCS93_15745 [Microscillaceae bacterium]|nr:hypothetical protein [Microscillaceae bacterium]